MKKETKCPFCEKGEKIYHLEHEGVLTTINEDEDLPFVDGYMKIRHPDSKCKENSFCIVLDFVNTKLIESKTRNPQDVTDLGWKLIFPNIKYCPFCGKRVIRKEE